MQAKRQHERPRCRDRSERDGVILLFHLVVMMALVAMASLAVDFGRVVLVKSELRSAADAAARAAAQTLTGASDATAIALAKSAAQQVAALNFANEAPVVLDPNDIDIGNWDATQTPSFSTARTPLNAAQVTVRCDTTKANPVQLIFGSVAGATSCDVVASSIAQNPGKTSTYGFAGLQSVSFGSIGVLAKVDGDIVSDGNMNIGWPLGIGVLVSGDARSSAGTVRHGSLACIAGSSSALGSSLNYPAVTLPGSYDNSGIAGFLDNSSNFNGAVIVDIPAGTYVVHDLNLLAGLIVNLQGPVTFYVTGNFNMAATVNLLGQTNTDPSNLTVKVMNGGSVNFLASLLTPVAMNVYAPQSAISIGVSVNHYTGSLIGKTLAINLPVAGVFTEKKLTAAPQISIVK